MRRPGGYGIVTGPEGITDEHDTYTCCHCNRVVVVRPGSGKERGFCFLCHAPHCGRGGCWKCVPFERKLEAYERRHQLWKMF